MLLLLPGPLHVQGFFSNVKGRVRTWAQFNTYCVFTTGQHSLLDMRLQLQRLVSLHDSL